MRKLLSALAALCVMCSGALAEPLWGEGSWRDHTLDERIDYTCQLLQINTEIDKYDPTYLSILGLEHIIPMTSGMDGEGNQNIVYLGIDEEMRRQYIAYLKLFGYRLVSAAQVQEGVTCWVLLQPDPGNDALLVPPEIRLYHLEGPNSFVIRYDVGYETLDRAIRTRLLSTDAVNNTGLICEQAIVTDECLLYANGVFTLPEPYPATWEEDLHILRDSLGDKATITTDDRLELLILRLRTCDGSTPNWQDMTLCLMDYRDSDDDVADGGRTVALPLAFAAGMTVTDKTVTLDAHAKGEEGVIYALIPFRYDEDNRYRLFISTGSGTLFEWPSLEIGPMTILE